MWSAPECLGSDPKKNAEKVEKKKEERKGKEDRVDSREESGGSRLTKLNIISSIRSEGEWQGHTEVERRYKRHG